MSGISTSSLLVLLTGVFAGASPGHLQQPPTGLPHVTRAEMIETAKRMATHRWIVSAANLRAPCVQHYKSSFHDQDRITGVAYDWGGMDDVAAFDQKLAAGHAAGSHASDGVSACTTGIDCSGFASLCWKQMTKYGTATISRITQPFNGNIFRELKPGDALNLPGTHIVLFDSYNPDGTINVYEASGRLSRVVLSRNVPWARFQQPNHVYQPIRYVAAVD